MRDSMNIVHSVASIALSKGGPSYTVASLAAAQTALIEGTVHVVFKDERGEEPAMLADPIRLHPVRSSFPGSVAATRNILRDLLRPDSVLHDQGIWHSQNFAATGLAAKHGLPYAISTHGMLEPWALAYRRRKKAIARWLYQDRLLQAARCLMATSEQERLSLRNLGFRNPIAVIPNGVDLQLPPRTRRNRTSENTALFLSRIHPKKGVVHAIEAWHALRPAGWKLKIVGPNELGHREQLESLVRRHELHECVSFHEAVSGDDKHRCYDDADLFLLPTYSENFGVVIAEALAYELPVITTKGTPWDDLPRRGCGWYVDIGTPALIDALQQAFRLPAEELRAMGRRGRAWVGEAFQWPNIAAQNIAVYEWMLGRRGNPDFVEI